MPATTWALGDRMLWKAAIYCRIVVTALAIAAAGTTWADSIPQVEPGAPSATPASDDFQETGRGHGSISVAYLNTYVNGFHIDNSTELPLVFHSQGIALDFEYFVADTWSLHVGLPYIDNRYNGVPHCPTTAPPQCANVPALNPQHPESAFHDDNQYHGAWQDWTLGTAWHTHINDYFIVPSLTAIVPSHDYPFFTNAAVGQRLKQLMLATTLAHQFAFTNFYYKVGYAYVISEHVLGIDTGYQRFDGELGWFVNEKFSVRGFLTGRIGNGISAAELSPTLTAGATNAYWYHHDQIARHNYRGIGVGFDYALSGRYTFSAGVQHAIYGNTVYDFKYALETRLTRSF
jgi:hypothetical protein